MFVFNIERNVIACLIKKNTVKSDTGIQTKMDCSNLFANIGTTIMSKLPFYEIH